MPTLLTEARYTLLARKWLAGLALLAVLTVFLAALVPPAPVYANSQVEPTPSLTPLPILPAKIGSNAHLVIGALVLVAIIIFGVVLNIRRRK